jgi:hypothetical protein
MTEFPLLLLLVVGGVLLLLVVGGLVLGIGLSVVLTLIVRAMNR